MFQTLINHLTPYLTATNAYHAAAFLLTAAGSQYAVQVVKVISRDVFKNKLSANTLRTLNGLFNTAFTALGAFATGGISLGNLVITSTALSGFSAWIYRIHKSYLYTTAEQVVEKGLDEAAAPGAAESSITTPTSAFAGD